jgi:hypothetical protein
LLPIWAKTPAVVVKNLVFDGVIFRFSLSQTLVAVNKRRCFELSFYLFSLSTPLSTGNKTKNQAPDRRIGSYPVKHLGLCKKVI